MVADGYKDTEIGVIPIEWDVVNVGKYTKLMGGYAFKSKDAKEFGTKWLKIANVGIKKIKWEQTSYLEDVYQEEYKKFLLKENDIVLAMTRPILSMKLKIAKITNSDIPALLNQRVGKFIFDDNVNDEFMYQLFQHIDFVKLLMLKIMGTDPPNVSSEQLESIQIPLPPLKEQEKIANILSTADDKIDAIATQIEKAQTLKKGLLQKLLSEGIGHNKFKDSELGKIPKSWEVVELRNIGKVSMCKRIMKSETTEYGEIPFYKIGTFGKEANSYISQEIYEDYKKKYSFPKKGDILISASGTIGRTVIYDGVPAYFQDSNIVWIDNKEDKSLNSFLFYVYITVKWHTDGNTIARLYNENLRRIKIPLPPLEEQKQIADILSTADEKLEVLRAKKEKYETLKKGLLQKLLSGEVRV